jgi:hypothetical protein
VGESDLFTEALGKADPAERSAFLDRACAADPALRRRVEALLRAHGRGRFTSGCAVVQAPRGGGQPFAERTPLAPAVKNALSAHLFSLHFQPILGKTNLSKRRGARVLSPSPAGRNGCGGRG